MVADCVGVDEQGNFDDAERAYNSALEHEPRNTTAQKEQKQVIAIRTLFTRAQAALQRVRCAIRHLLCYVIVQLLVACLRVCTWRWAL